MSRMSGGGERLDGIEVTEAKIRVSGNRELEPELVPLLRLDGLVVAACVFRIGTAQFKVDEEAGSACRTDVLSLQSFLPLAGDAREQLLSLLKHGNPQGILSFTPVHADASAAAQDTPATTTTPQGPEVDGDGVVVGGLPFEDPGPTEPGIEPEDDIPPLDLVELAEDVTEPIAGGATFPTETLPTPVDLGGIDLELEEYDMDAIQAEMAAQEPPAETPTYEDGFDPGEWDGVTLPGDDQPVGDTVGHVKQGPVYSDDPGAPGGGRKKTAAEIEAAEKGIKPSVSYDELLELGGDPEQAVRPVGETVGGMRDYRGGTKSATDLLVEAEL